MELAQVDKDRWVEYVLEVLDGEAMEACYGISLTEVFYLKTALFTYFNVTPENRIVANFSRSKSGTGCHTSRPHPI